MKNPALVRTMAGTVAVRALLSRLFLGLATAGTEAFAKWLSTSPALFKSGTKGLVPIEENTVKYMILLRETLTLKNITKSSENVVSRAC